MDRPVASSMAPHLWPHDAVHLRPEGGPLEPRDGDAVRGSERGLLPQDAKLVEQSDSPPFDPVDDRANLFDAFAGAFQNARRK